MTGIVNKVYPKTINHLDTYLSVVPVILERQFSLHVFSNDYTKSATAVCFNSSKPPEVALTSKPLQSLALATTTPPFPGTVCLQKH